jgi:inner membrane protein
MEPVTHFLTGTCIGRAGLNRKTAYAVLAATLAAEAADIDMLWGLAGPVQGLRHHRGITHTFLAAPFVAAAVTGVVWLWHRQRPGRSSPGQGRRLNAAAKWRWPSIGAETGRVRWAWVYLSSLIAALSHIFLDWTNDYGVRPFFPFNPRWYAGSFVFIAEPVLWALLLSAVVLPWLFGLTDREIGARPRPFRGQGWAIFALTGMGLLWCWRWAEHAQAVAMIENTEIASEPTRRVTVSPYPINPFRWHAIVETEHLFQTAEVNTRTGTIDTDPARDSFYKPADTPAVEAARRTPLGQVYLDWGKWAVVRDLGQDPVGSLEPPRLPPGRTWTTVEFYDLRFAYPFRGSGTATEPYPLSGWVYIVDGREEAGEGMGSREQR